MGWLGWFGLGWFGLGLFGLGFYMLSTKVIIICGLIVRLISYYYIPGEPVGGEAIRGDHR